MVSIFTVRDANLADYKAPPPDEFGIRQSLLKVGTVPSK